MKSTDGADLLAWQMRAAGLPPFEREVLFHPQRKWRIDLADKARRIAIEVDGSVWTGGRHTRGAGITADCAKYCELAIAGYRLLRVTTQQVQSGEALKWVERAIQSQTETKRDG